MKKEIRIVGKNRGSHITDGEGRELWWFGSSPPEGIPSPKAFIEYINHKCLQDIAPPWAAIVRGIKNEGFWACTDLVGLQHIFLRILDERILVGPDLIKIASAAPVYLDAIGAYELMVLGNPQSTRTLFVDIERLLPSTVVRLDYNVSEVTYWKLPELACVESELAIDIFSKALKRAVIQSWKKEDTLELTAGRDTMLILSVLLSEGFKVKTWTHGYKNSIDVLGARQRAKTFGIDHQIVSLELLDEMDPSEAFSFSKQFLYASNGMANIFAYWHLPWVIKQVGQSASISGIGGEAYRGMYYRWVGHGFMPYTVGKFFLLHGKLREYMPFANPIINSKYVSYSDRIIKNDLNQSLRSFNILWHSLDAYYLSSRAPFFAGTIFSATNLWKTVRAPFFDPSVLNCLPLIPIELRRHSRIQAEVTTRFLKQQDFITEPSYSEKTVRHSGTRIVNRLFKELRGSHFASKSEVARTKKLLNSKECLSLLNTDEMITKNLYDELKLERLLNNIKYSNYIPVMVGSIATIELAVREVKSKFKGISLST